MEQTSASSVESQSPFTLSVSHLSKSFFMGRTTVPVLGDVTLDMRAGETVSVIGASGAGKSTMLHIIGGLDKPTGGSVIFQGQDLYRLSAKKRTLVRAWRIGFVFQFYHLLPELDVLENVILPAMNQSRRLFARPVADGSNERFLRERAMSLLKSVGLTDRAGHLPAELSGGEQQRTALARALMNQPDLVLVDEPTGNLDSVTGDHVLDTLFALIREKRLTLILVTHNLEVARRCDRILKLERGCLAFY